MSPILQEFVKEDMGIFSWTLLHFCRPCNDEQSHLALEGAQFLSQQNFGIVGRLDEENVPRRFNYFSVTKTEEHF